MLQQETLLLTSLYHAATWAVIQQMIPSKRTCFILDVGGGNGIWSIRLAKLGHKVVYVDLSERMAHVARINALNQDVQFLITQGDAHNLNFFPTDRFDLVLAVGDLICYAGNPVEVCQQLYKQCKPGGRMIISAMGRLGILPYLLEMNSIFELQKYLVDGLWIEFRQQELGHNIETSLTARTYTVSGLSDLCQLSGWETNRFFGAGILRTLLGRPGLEALIKARGMDFTLSLEQQLAQIPALLDCAMEFGLIATKPVI